MFFKSSAVFGSLILSSASLAGAAPARLNARQSGDLDCNIARVKVVGNVLEAARTARNLTQDLACDQTATALLANVTTNIIQTEDAIADIVLAVFNNQTAPSDSRQKVADGLTFAFEAASNITSPSTNVMDKVNQLKNELLLAGSAGNDVLTQCV
ncbi:hypothetical protein BXZ70DRAFT_55192 [Cristinia sonorae]|uniref:Cell wall galactomannoprotein n=1 Tax=Cristinia sonorae TaxID=1940300 RepID=A0A8K0US03_9AGAR|nr:hypothetical protein BXZ70DRAFT_55192 [Cristinia sonorae]